MEEETASIALEMIIVANMALSPMGNGIEIQVRFTPIATIDNLTPAPAPANVYM